ncbi:MAG: tetratricopeptide repeat protein [Verrucomicrobiota bacterium]|jgi:TPR repeat protein
MKASLWALIFSALLVFTAKAQQPAFPPATNALVTTEASKLAEIRAKAEKGDVQAQDTLGLFYEGGTSVPQDYAEAAKWYRKAADQDYALAQVHIGVCYNNGQGVTQSYSDAINWYRKAAEHGLVPAAKSNGCNIGGLEWDLLPLDILRQIR